MTIDDTARARPEPIKAVPVRHPGRWVTTVVVAVLVAMFLHLLITNDRFQWSKIFVSYQPGYRGIMFTGPVLTGLRGTLLLTTKNPQATRDADLLNRLGMTSRLNRAQA